MKQLTLFITGVLLLTGSVNLLRAEENPSKLFKVKYITKLGTCVPVAKKKYECNLNDASEYMNSYIGPVPTLPNKTECDAEGPQCWIYTDLSVAAVSGVESDWTEVSRVP